MRNRRWIWWGVVAVLCGLSFLAGGVVAQDAPEGGGMEMPAWMHRTAEHEALARMAGTWEVSMRWWTHPDAEPMTSTGTTVMAPVLGGNFLRQEFTHEWMGMTFHGLGFIGYDTVDREYVSIWMEDAQPVLWVGRGKEKDGVITYEGTHPDPVTGVKQPGIFTFRREGDDKAILEIYGVAGDGSRVKQGEMTYRRTK